MERQSLNAFGRSIGRVWAARRGLWRFAVRNAATAVGAGKLDLVGRTVVITGGSSGIGFSTARACLSKGASVAIVARDEGALERARIELSRFGTVIAVPCDVTDGGEVNAMVAAVEETLGPVEVLVNNAGRSIRRSTVNSLGRLHDYRRTMEVNYFGAVTCTLAVLPGMLERGGGRIVNVSSIATQARGARFGAYVASKCAVDGFGDVLAGEVAGRGVTVTSVKMPLTRTPMIAPTDAYRAIATISPERAAKLVLRGIEYGRPEVSTIGGRAAAASIALNAGSAVFWRQVDYLMMPESKAALGDQSRSSMKGLPVSAVGSGEREVEGLVGIERD
ncbi:SDR family NAD(P)-dependent oxidoreductase [Gordonia malaquae]|uniref:SDR family NAD(P)-dependent oxidoreductase n=1 Tax=Gordonia malaquae TaxID=410332 RepID=UPI0030FE75E5